MNKFLSLFSLLLGIVALVSLFVGGLGITNMMLVSLSERLREIGIRKAFGATDRSIRYQYLSEALFLCLMAGAIGLVAGFALYQAGIWTASKVISKVAFEWVFNIPAILISLVSILVVGVCSGLIPALRAERLSVIEALRSD